MLDSLVNILNYFCFSAKVNYSQLDRRLDRIIYFLLQAYALRSFYTALAFRFKSLSQQKRANKNKR